MKLNLHQTKALSLVGKYCLSTKGAADLDQEETDHVCSFHMPGTLRAPHMDATQERQMAGGLPSLR